MAIERIEMRLPEGEAHWTVINKLKLYPGNVWYPEHSIASYDENSDRNVDVECVVKSADFGTVFPVAVTEEVWNLGEELALGRVLLFALAALFFLAVFIYVLHDHVGFPPTRKAFLLRVASTYGVTLLISALLLLGVDRIDLQQDPLIALKRTILVAFPASFAATGAADSLPMPS